MGVYTYATRTGGRFAPLAGTASLLEVQPALFPQTPGSLDWLLGPALQELPQSEDAFQVSVFAPEDASDLPVMVFLPGGGFVSGAGTVRWYDAQHFAQAQGCVVIVVNYRVGLLAHNASVGGGNLVPEELLLALSWVQQHARTLGGNPQDVTLAGQSAGAFWAFALAQLPEAKGLFQRVYLGSLSYQPPMDEHAAAERQQVLDQALEGTGLADASTEQLLRGGGALAKHWAGRGLGLYPSADAQVPADLFDVRAAVARLHVDQVLLSHTADEATAFIGMAPEQAFVEPSVRGFIGAHFEEPDRVFSALREDAPDATPKQLMVQAMTLHQIQLYATEFADAAAHAGKHVQLLRFSVSSPLPNAGSAHCFELPFLFANREQWADAPMLEGLAEQDFTGAAAQLSSAVGSFVRSGSARGVGGEQLMPHEPGAKTSTQITAQGLDGFWLERRFQAKRTIFTASTNAR